MKRPETGSGDAEIRDLYRRATGGRPVGDCPPADELAALALGELEPAARGRLAAHVAECSDCALELAAARTVVAPAAAETEPRPALQTAPTPVRPRPAPRPWPLLLAAALALCAVGGLALWQSVQPPAPAADPVRSATPAPGTVHPVRGALLTSPPTRLTWPPQPGATAYRVLLLDSDGEDLWQSDWIERPTAALPPDLLSTPGSFLWRVEVEGEVQRTSLGPYRFSVEPVF